MRVSFISILPIVKIYLEKEKEENNKNSISLEDIDYEKLWLDSDSVEITNDMPDQTPESKGIIPLKNLVSIFVFKLIF